MKAKGVKSSIIFACFVLNFMMFLNSGFTKLVQGNVQTKLAGTTWTGKSYYKGGETIIKFESDGRVEIRFVDYYLDDCDDDDCDDVERGTYIQKGNSIKMNVKDNLNVSFVFTATIKGSAMTVQFFNIEGEKIDEPYSFTKVKK